MNTRTITAIPSFCLFDGDEYYTGDGWSQQPAEAEIYLSSVTAFREGREIAFLHPELRITIVDSASNRAVHRISQAFSGSPRGNH